MRALLFILIYFLLNVIDGLSTWIAIENGTGVEVNPHVNTESLRSIFFSPTPIFYGSFFFLFLALTEIYSEKVHSMLVSGHPLASLGLFPLLFLWMLSLITMNNMSNILEFGTPLAWFASLFDFITKDRHDLTGIVLMVLNVVALPFLFRIGIRIYSPSSTHDYSVTSSNS